MCYFACWDLCLLCTRGTNLFLCVWQLFPIWTEALRKEKFSTFDQMNTNKFAQLKSCSPQNICGASQKDDDLWASGDSDYAVAILFLLMSLKQVPIYFNCLADSCNAVLLWSSRNVRCPTTLRLLENEEKITEFSFLGELFLQPLWSCYPAKHCHPLIRTELMFTNRNRRSARHEDGMSWIMNRNSCSAPSSQISHCFQPLWLFLVSSSLPDPSRPQGLLSLHQGGGGEARPDSLGQQDAVRGDVVWVWRNRSSSGHGWRRRVGAQRVLLALRQPPGLDLPWLHCIRRRGRKEWHVREGWAAYLCVCVCVCVCVYTLTFAVTPQGEQSELWDSPSAVCHLHHWEQLSGSCEYLTSVQYLFFFLTSTWWRPTLIIISQDTNSDIR